MRRVVCAGGGGRGGHVMVLPVRASLGFPEPKGPGLPLLPRVIRHSGGARATFQGFAPDSRQGEALLDFSGCAFLKTTSLLSEVPPSF